MTRQPANSGSIWLAALAIAGCVILVCAAWLPFLPNSAGRLGPDYAYWLPNFLAGAYWRLGSPWWAMPWFSPAACGGVPLHANPQGAYLSMPQLLVAWVGPIAGIRASFTLYAAAGCAGSWFLARARFGLGPPAALLAAALFTFNGLFAVRMVVGHLSFGPFMLLPAMAACILAPSVRPRGWLVLRVCAFGVLLAACLQAGTAVLLPPMLLSLVILSVMHALATRTPTRPGLALLAAGTALGACLCAGKLAAVAALMAHVPRDGYPLPGFVNIPATIWVTVRSVFLWPTDGMSRALANSRLRLELHEFDDRAGPVPLLLMAAWAWMAWRGRAPTPAAARTRLLCYALAALLAVPVLLNTLLPVWTPFLKALPVIGSSSSLLRWFAAYILPACLGGALALDALARARRLPTWTYGTWPVAAAGALATLLLVALPDRSFYGPAGIGAYDPAPIAAAFADLRVTGRAPEITALTQSNAPDGTAGISLAGQDALTRGLSQLACYEPVFGYRLETLPHGVVHPGGVLDVIPGPDGAHLNLINPACYVFPGANGCRPGDAFAAGARDAAHAFASYQPWPFAKPVWASLADWLGLASLGGTALAASLAGLALVRHARA